VAGQWYGRATSPNRLQDRSPAPTS
jgi:hypothetical protein